MPITFRSGLIPTGTNWSLVDGSLNARTTAGNFSSILNGFVSRPPWSVAGVDYGVGLYSNCTIDTGTNIITETGVQSAHIIGQKVTLRTANGGTLPSGVSLDTAYFVRQASGSTYKIATTNSDAAIITLGGSPNLVVALKVPVAGTNCMPPGANYPSGQTLSPFINVNVTGASDTTNGNQASSGTITIDAYDFSFDNGITIAFDGSSGTVNINNTYWRVGSNLECALWSSTLPTTTCNLSYCEIDGGGVAFANSNFNTLGHLLYQIPKGTYQYCWMHHIVHPIVASPIGPYTLQFCLINNLNYGIQSSHSDGFFPSVGSNISGSVQQFSTWHQPAAQVGAGGNGYPGECDTSIGIFLQPNNSLTLNNITINNNTVTGVGTTGHMNTVGPTSGAAFADIWDIEPKVGNSVTNITIRDNYVNSTAIDTIAFIIVDNGGAGTVSGQSYLRNISMNTGATIAANVVGVQ